MHQPRNEPADTPIGAAASTHIRFDIAPLAMRIIRLVQREETPSFLEPDVIKIAGRHCDVVISATKRATLANGVNDILRMNEVSHRAIQLIDDSQLTSSMTAQL